MQAGTPRHPDLPPWGAGHMADSAVQRCRAILVPKVPEARKAIFWTRFGPRPGQSGGGGYYRNSKTPSYAGVGQIEPATWKRPTWSYFRFFFRRYLRPKGANTAKTQRFWVPSRLLFMEVRKPICGAFFFLRKQQKSSVTPNKTTSSNNILLQIVPYF